MSCFTTIDFQYTYALYHERGENNFISKGLLLGTNIRSDVDQWQLGCRLVTPLRMIIDFHIGNKEVGLII